MACALQRHQRAAIYDLPVNRRHEEEQLLIEAVSHGQPEALQELYHRYRGLLHTVAIKVVRNSSDAEEVMQDVFLYLWNRANSYSSTKGRVPAWLAMLARRRAIDRLRQQMSYGRATARLETDLIQQSGRSASHQLLDQKACLDDLRALLKQQLERLPPAQKQAVEMAFFDGMSQRKIASATRLPLGTVKTRIELGLRKLSNRLWTTRWKIS